MATVAKEYILTPIYFNKGNLRGAPLVTFHLLQSCHSCLRDFVSVINLFSWLILVLLYPRKRHCRSSLPFHYQVIRGLLGLWGSSMMMVNRIYTCWFNWRASFRSQIKGCSTCKIFLFLEAFIQTFRLSGLAPTSRCMLKWKVIILTRVNYR